MPPPAARIPVPEGELLGGRFAQITMPGIQAAQAGEERYVSAGQAAVRTLDAAAPCGWLVDLRADEGGNMWPMLTVLAPLLEIRGDDVVPGGQVVGTNPVRLTRPAPPVAVLTPQYTEAPGKERSCRSSTGQSAHLRPAHRRIIHTDRTPQVIVLVQNPSAPESATPAIVACTPEACINAQIATASGPNSTQPGTALRSQVTPPATSVLQVAEHAQPDRGEPKSGEVQPGGAGNGDGQRGAARIA